MYLESVNVTLTSKFASTCQIQVNYMLPFYYYLEGVMASLLTTSVLLPDQAVQVRALAGHIVLCS